MIWDSCLLVIVFATLSLCFFAGARSCDRGCLEGLGGRQRHLAQLRGEPCQEGEDQRQEHHAREGRERGAIVMSREGPSVARHNYGMQLLGIAFIYVHGRE